jgi:hypothetical protein
MRAAAQVLNELPHVRCYRSPGTFLIMIVWAAYTTSPLVDDLIDRAMADPRLNANPRVNEAHERAPAAGVQVFRHRTAVLGRGGPQTYSGRPMGTRAGISCSPMASGDPAPLSANLTSDCVPGFRAHGRCDSSSRGGFVSVAHRSICSFAADRLRRPIASPTRQPLTRPRNSLTSLRVVTYPRRRTC